MIRNRVFSTVALAALTVLAMHSTAADAATAPAASQLPGKGTVSNGTATAGSISNATQNIAIGGNAVIDWGTGTDINAVGTGGFAIGTAAGLTFSGSAGSAVLNIDSSGNASQIFGKLTADGVDVFVANQNGIVVGGAARLSGTGGISLIANTLAPTAAADFAASPAKLAYSGTGGDMTVLQGAAIGNAVLVSGGNAVNLDLAAFTGGNVSVAAGVPSAGAGAPGQANAMAALNTSGQLAGGALVGFSSAGSAVNAGTLDLSGVGAYRIAGLLTNTGKLVLPATNGSVRNVGELITRSGGDFSGGLTNESSYSAAGDILVSGGKLTNTGEITQAANTTVSAGGFSNSGTFDASGYLLVNGGDLANDGRLSVPAGVSVDGGSLTNTATLATGVMVSVTNGNLLNSGALSGAWQVSVVNGSITNTRTGVLSDAAIIQTSRGDGGGSPADYSITNAGLIVGTSYGYYLSIGANENEIYVRPSPSTGSFTNTGTVQLASATQILSIKAKSDLTLAGQILLSGQALSQTNPLGQLELLSNAGTATLSTPVTFNSQATIAGSKVRLMADLTGVGSGTIALAAGDKIQDDYAIRIGSGATASASTVYVEGYQLGNHPNVILQGVLAGGQVNFGDGGSSSGVAVSDVFSGPNGGIRSNGVIVFAFTGRIKAVPYINSSNFRYNFLPIFSSGSSDTVSIALCPVAYTTNGTSNGLSAVNLLVTGNVSLAPTGLTAPVSPGGTVVGDAMVPNTHMVVQATGSISTAGDFNWPGYVYLGTVAANGDGSAGPGTLGSGTIRLGGNLNNVLPGSVAAGGGIHFITQMPLAMNGHTVTTNANSWINFGTYAITREYASGEQGSGLFFGGAQGAGNAVNYGTFNPALFVTQAPSSAR